MVTLTKYGAKYNRNILFLEGLSTDTKPTDEFDGLSIQNGSEYTEVDTGKKFLFDYDNATWYEVQTGGGGGTSGGIVLVGTTTTQLTDGATTNPITVDGQSYTAQPNDAVIYGNKEFLFDGTNWHEFGDLSGLASKDIGAMTGYEKPNATSAIGTSDTLNQAVGKLEKALDGKQATIDANNKLSSDLVDDTNKTHKFATQAQLDQINTNKNNILTANAELIELVDNGAKNLFLPTAESKTNPTGFTGTITNNGDGSYTINGTAGSSPYYLKLGTINLKAGTYVLYARPTQQSGFYVYNDGAWTDSDVNDNRYATFATDTTQNIYLRVDSNATVSNYTIYPMICYKSAWDISQAYEPYCPTLAELYALVKSYHSGT